MRVVSVAIFALSCVGAAAINVTAYTTFYGAKDNCPPGGAIAYPKIHQLAGGVGTYADPITYASSKKETPPGTIIYVFFLQKYFIMEDDCGECDDDWSKHKKYHFDLWTGPDAVTPGPNLIACEDALTRNAADVEIDPPSTYDVVTRPLFNGTSLECIVPAPPCHDQGNTCGNECAIPSAGPCQAIAAELLLGYPRFLQLNPKLGCPRELAAGTNVCMGGTCGD